MFSTQISIPQWLQLPQHIRSRMIEVFELPRSARTEVFNNIVMCDGYTHEDLKNITIEKMQKFLGSGVEDYYQLLDATVAKVEDEYQLRLRGEQEERELQEEEELQGYELSAAQAVKNVVELTEAVKKRRGRPPTKVT